MKAVWQDIVDIDRQNNKVTVCNSKGQKYIINVSPDMICHVQGRSVLRGDLAKVIKSPVSGEWVMIDFKFDPKMYDYDGGCDVSNDTEPEYMITLEDYV